MKVSTWIEVAIVYVSNYHRLDDDDRQLALEELNRLEGERHEDDHEYGNIDS